MGRKAPRTASLNGCRPWRIILPLVALGAGRCWCGGWCLCAAVVAGAGAVVGACVLRWWYVVRCGGVSGPAGWDACGHGATRRRKEHDGSLYGLHSAGTAQGRRNNLEWKEYYIYCTIGRYSKTGRRQHHRRSTPASEGGGGSITGRTHRPARAGAAASPGGRTGQRGRGRRLPDFPVFLREGFPGQGIEEFPEGRAEY